MKRTSELLNDVAQAVSDKGEITIGDFVAILGNRSFAMAILIFSLPNSLPIPSIPGFSTITGLPIVFIASQSLWGRKTIWLPRSIAEKHFRQEILTKVIGKAVPIMVWMERFLHPRLTFLCESRGERFISFFIAVMALILSLPLLGGNFLPGLSISLLALALLEDDGLFAALSILFCTVSLYLMCSVIMVVMTGAIDWISGVM